MNLKKLIALAVVLSIAVIGGTGVLAQGPPENVGPPADAGPPHDNHPHSGDDENEKDRRGPPEHANVPDHVRKMLNQRFQEGVKGPPAFASVPDFVRERIFGQEVTDKVYDEVYAVTFEETNELEGVDIYVFSDDDREDQVGETVTTDVYGKAEKELEDGEYKLTATAEDYKEFEDEFEIDEDNNEIEFELEEKEGEAFFEVTGLWFVPGSVERGGELSVRADIENTGYEDGEQDINLLANWYENEEEENGEDYENITFEELSLEAGESDWLEFEKITVPEDDDVLTGKRTIRVESEDDEFARGINVR